MKGIEKVTCPYCHKKYDANIMFAVETYCLYDEHKTRCPDCRKAFEVEVTGVNIKFTSSKIKGEFN
jgi:transposase-like protein